MVALRFLIIVNLISSIISYGTIRLQLEVRSVLEPAIAMLISPYNDIEGGLAGIGPNGIGTGVYENNIDEDPEFVDVSAFDFHIL